MQSNQSQIDRFYQKYQHLSYVYANRVFNYEKVGLQKDDIVQEMKIKIYISILGYARRWAEYRQTGVRKPVPMEYWLRTALVNKVIDYSKMFGIDRAPNVLSLAAACGGFEEDRSLDLGFWNTLESKINLEDLICELNGVDLIANLSEDRKKCYCMFTCGFEMKELSAMFPHIPVQDFISHHNAYLKKTNRNELLDFTKAKYVCNIGAGSRKYADTVEEDSMNKKQKFFYNEEFC